MNITGDAKLVASAFVKARGAMNATVSKDGKGNFGNYATLAAIVEATAAPFAQHGLAIIQEASIDEGGGLQLTLGSFTSPVAQLSLRR